MGLIIKASISILYTFKKIRDYTECGYRIRGDNIVNLPIAYFLKNLFHRDFYQKLDTLSPKLFLIMEGKKGHGVALSWRKKKTDSWQTLWPL